MKFVNTLIVNGESYQIQDLNAVTEETFTAALGDVEAALAALHAYAEGFGGGGA